MAVNVKDILDKANAITTDTGKDDGLNNARATLAGGVVGGLIGLMVTYSLKKKLLWGAAGGAIAGIVLVKIFVPSGKTSS